MPPVFPINSRRASLKASKKPKRPRQTRRVRQRMDMKQILFFGLLLVPVWTCKMNRCYDEHELSEAAERKLRSHYPQSRENLPGAAADSPASCPVELYKYQQPQEIRDRSLSPWRYVFVTMKDHYPSTYAEAQCLCSGCIVFHKKTPEESPNYNSVYVIQSRVFLKRERCPEGNKYYLKPVSVDVRVGCTCARAKTSSS